MTNIHHSEFANSLTKVWSLLTSAHRKEAIKLLALMLFSAALEALSIGFILPALYIVSNPSGIQQPFANSFIHIFGNPTGNQLVVGFAVLVLFVFALKNAFIAFLLVRQNTFAYRVSADLAMRLFETYLRQPIAFHLQRNSAELVQNVIGEVAIVGSNVVTPAMLMLTETIVLAGLALMLFFIEPIGAATATVLIGLATLLFGRSVLPRNADLGAQRQFHIGHMARHLQQGLSAVKDVKLLGREFEFLQRFKLHGEQNATAAIVQSVLLGLPRLWLELLTVGGLVTVILSMIDQGKSPAAMVPVVGLFAAAAFRLMPSVNRIVSANQSLKFGESAIDRVHADLHLPADEHSSAFHGPLTFHREIELNDVCFQYAYATATAIERASLMIPVGSTVGIAGATGAGKTTLIDLILGLLTPTNGSIKVDGVDIQTRLRQWQDKIGYVPQSIYLTDDTLRRNIAFGLADANIDDMEVWRAVDAAQLQSLVASLPQGLDTDVGERGIRLSGGQRQRIGIARALYHNPEILVFDEATNALDTEMESQVMAAVHQLHGKRTIIIVSHRPGTLQLCDSVFHLENGRLYQNHGGANAGV